MSEEKKTLGKTILEDMITLLKKSTKEQDEYFKSLPPDKTSSVLVEDLKKKPQSEIRDKLISLAERHFYDDFKSPYPAPKYHLNLDLNSAGFHDLALKVINGEYD